MIRIKRIDDFPKEFKAEWKASNKRMGFGHYSKNFYFGAFEGKRLVGYTHIKVNGGVGELKELIIKRGSLGNGYGKMMLNHFVKFCKAKKCHKLTLETSERHKEARKLYEKHGFRIESRKPDDKYHLTWYWYSKRL
ncbi:MAG: GNAT family N-acetyltransferase [Candidatus Micrarchaeota archaeon]|nr:GNAT family N-acetyltransferase [Candidatus Micrarchaeota archaeon]